MGKQVWATQKNLLIRREEKNMEGVIYGVEVLIISVVIDFKNQGMKIKT